MSNISWTPKTFQRFANGYKLFMAQFDSKFERNPKVEQQIMTYALVEERNSKILPSVDGLLPLFATRTLINLLKDAEKSKSKILLDLESSISVGTYNSDRISSNRIWNWIASDCDTSFYKNDMEYPYQFDCNPNYRDGGIWNKESGKRVFTLPFPFDAIFGFNNHFDGNIGNNQTNIMVIPCLTLSVLSGHQMNQKGPIRLKALALTREIAAVKRSTEVAIIEKFAAKNKSTKVQSDKTADDLLETPNHEIQIENEISRNINTKKNANI